MSIRVGAESGPARKTLVPGTATSEEAVASLTPSENETATVAASAAAEWES